MTGLKVLMLTMIINFGVNSAAMIKEKSLINEFYDSDFYVSETKFSDKEELFFENYDIKKNSLHILIPLGFEAKLKYILNGEIINADLNDKILNNSNLILIENKDDYILIGKGVCYKDIQPGIVKKIDFDCDMKLFKRNIIINVNMKNTEEENLKFTFFKMHSKINPFQDDQSFKRYNAFFDKSQHFIIPQGYFFELDPSSKPYEKNYYFLQPASYNVSGYTTASDIFSRLMSKFTLQSAYKNINEFGYIPMPYESQWLKKDYNIGSGYFDTRWNLDFAYQCLRAYDLFRNAEYLDMSSKILDYYVEYCNKNKIEIKDEIGEVGYLISDYSFGNENIKTHSSLNHHLMGIKALSYEAILRNDNRNSALIEKMMKGIEFTEEKWIKEDGDLHYAYFLDGSFGMQDYPTLTLNDLKDVKYLYGKLFNLTPKSLDHLIESKERWFHSEKSGKNP